MFSAFSWFFSFFDVCRFPAVTPARRGKCCSLSSIRSTSADADHRGITYISCIILNLCIPILHLFSQLYKQIIPIQQMIQKPPRLPVTETGAVRLRYLCFSKRSRNYLRGFLIAACPAFYKSSAKETACFRCFLLFALPFRPQNSKL